MNLKRQLYIRTLIISIALFLIGQCVFVNLFEFFEPKFDLLTFRVVENKKVIPTSILFSLTLFLTPILIFGTWRISRIDSIRKEIVSVLIVLSLMILAIWLRHLEVKAFYTHLFKNHLILIKDNKAKIQTIDPVNFVYYMFGGLCVGCIVSFLLLRSKI
jgi:hypothetical protein